MEKIRYCITKLDKELRGLDDIKELKVTPIPFAPLPSVPLTFPLPETSSGSCPEASGQPVPHPILAWILKLLTPEDPDLGFCDGTRKSGMFSQHPTLLLRSGWLEASA